MSFESVLHLPSRLLSTTKVALSFQSATLLQIFFKIICNPHANIGKVSETLVIISAKMSNISVIFPKPADFQ